MICGAATRFGEQSPGSGRLSWKRIKRRTYRRTFLPGCRKRRPLTRWRCALPSRTGSGSTRTAGSPCPPSSTSSAAHFRIALRKTANDDFLFIFKKKKKFVLMSARVHNHTKRHRRMKTARFSNFFFYIYKFF